MAGHHLVRRLLLAILVLWPCWLISSTLAEAVSGQAVWLEIDGAIGPASSDYFRRGLNKAVEQQASIVILRIDTPGGLDTSMRDIIQRIMTSPLPVITYVSPSGARAASAGAYILYASHIAAMAPATNVGAATPVQIAGFPGGKPPDRNKPADEHSAADPMHKKIINDAVAYIRGLAQMRDRNADWAEKAVREAASLSAEEALTEGVIDLIAADNNDLLEQLNGRTVTVLGQKTTLATSTLSIHHIEPDWRSRLLSVITDPNVAYILMLVGVYGLIYEFANPGTILPGVAGTISLLLALFAFQVLPINYAGLALMLLGIAFMIGEVFVTSFGALGVGGIIAFVVGSIMLLDTDIPGYGISIPLIAFFALSSAGLFMFVLGMAIRARTRPVVSGMEELIGSQGEALSDFEHDGRIRIHSESWLARSNVPVKHGQRVKVTGIDGLCLIIEPADGYPPEDISHPVSGGT